MFKKGVEKCSFNKKSIQLPSSDLSSVCILKPIQNPSSHIFRSMFEQQRALAPAPSAWAWSCIIQSIVFHGKREFVANLLLESGDRKLLITRRKRLNAFLTQTNPQNTLRGYILLWPGCLG